MSRHLRSALLQFMAEHGTVTSELLSKHLGVSRRHVQRELHDLVAERQVVSSRVPGTRRTAYYSLPKRAAGETQPLRRLLAAMEDAAGPELYQRILDLYIDDYYGNDLHRPLEELAHQDHRNMSWQPSTNGWWIEMRACPFPYWKGNPTVCEAETRVLSQHWKVPVINIADDGDRMRCRFFIPIRPPEPVLSPDGTEGQKR